MDTNDIVMSGIQLKKLLAKKVEPIMQECDLRSVELDILVFLYKHQSVDTAKGIVQQKHLSKAHISKSIDNLRSKGFLHIAEDANDHRMFRLRLTEHAKAIAAEVIGVYENCREIIQRDIDPQELTVFKRVIGQMIDNINHELE